MRAFPFRFVEKNFSSCCGWAGLAFLGGGFFFGGALAGGFEGSLTGGGFVAFSFAGSLEDFGVVLLVEDVSASVLIFISSFSPEIGKKVLS